MPVNLQSVNSWPHIYSFKRHEIFLIDGFGVLLSSVLITLFGFNPEWIGLPDKILFVLAFIAGFFMIYSFSCYLLKPVAWSWYLKVIAIANLIYGIATASMLIIYHNGVSTIGWLYFIGELMILVILARVELKIAARQMT